MIPIIESTVVYLSIALPPFNNRQGKKNIKFVHKMKKNKESFDLFRQVICGYFAIMKISKKIDIFFNKFKTKNVIKNPCLLMRG